MVKLSDKIKRTIRDAIKVNEIYIKQLSILKNPNACKILDLLEKHNSMSITELQEAVGLKSYNNAFLHVKRLEKVYLVITKRDHQAQGRPVKVRLSVVVKSHAGKFNK